MPNLILAVDRDWYLGAKGLRAANMIPAAITSRDGIRGREINTKKGTIAVLPVRGIISPRLDWVTEYFGGGSSTESLGRHLESLVSDPDVSLILLDIDSPGGTVAGTPEFAEQVFQARSRKPIIAIANSLAASAAYWIATAANELYITPSGEAGSIGVFAEHLDISKFLEKEGIKPTLIHAGEFKVEGNQYSPLTDEAAAEIQRSVNGYFGMFIKAVAKHRGTTEARVRKDFGRGRLVRAEEAVARGMADGIDSYRSLIDRIIAGRPSARQIAATQEIEKVAREFNVPTPAERRAESERIRREELSYQQRSRTNAAR